MERIAVISKNIHSIGYDPSTETLEVKFDSGAIFQYYNVPATVHAELMSSPSKGVYFDYKVKNSYRYNKVVWF
ncbi:MAG TPA: KTSC domain-containing protein [Patescibacteria group bacterium]|nr:KTSC domain-containing protein [Patescibacteria group bacterium]